MEIGFKPDDWALYFGYKTIGSNPLSKLLEVWGQRGIYTTYQVYYMGLLETLVEFDYHSFQAVNLIIKSLATLALFPVVLIIFNNRLLAILTTIFYAISPASIGPLEFVVKGSDYIAIFWMCIFLIIYYWTVKNHPGNLLWLTMNLILLVVTLAFSPIRLFPLLFLLPLIEVYLLVKNKNLSNFSNTLRRMLLFYLPFIILIMYSPDSIIGFVQAPFTKYSKIIEGNWHLILVPFSGIGLTFITNQYFGLIFGSLRVDSLEKYIHFLFGGPMIIYGFLTLIVAFSKSRKPWLFFLFAFILNFILEILVFFIVTHSQYLPSIQGLHYEPTELYAALFGIYIVVLGFTCFIEWIKKDENDNLLQAFWIGSLFLFLFTFTTWIFAPFGTGFSGTSYYLVVASIGSSFLLSTFLVSIYRKAKYLKKGLFIISLGLIFTIIFSYLWMSVNEIHDSFTYLLVGGRSAWGQQLLQGRFRDHIKDLDFTKPAFFYFDTSEIHGDRPFYSEGFLASFPFWMHFQNKKLVDGCVEIFFEDRQKLASLIKEKDGEDGFIYRGLCVKDGKSSYKDIFYQIENFYAFKIKSMEFIDIKEEVIRELDFRTDVK